jgi:adenylate cyclase
VEREALMADKRPQSVLPYSLAAVFSQLQPWQARLLLLAVAAAVVLLLRAGFAGTFRSVEEQIGNIGWTLVADSTPEERFSIVAIDEKSLQEIGPWPWSRATMAQLSERLAGAGVQLQIYDIAFPEAREGDAAFVAALQNTNAVLSQVPDLQNSGEVIRSGQLSHPLSGIACENAPQAQNFVGNAQAFSGIAKGHIAPWVDSDGAVRKVPAVVCVDGQAYPAIGISALLQATGASSWQAAVVAGAGMLEPSQQLTLASYPGLVVPLDAAGNLRVSFRNAPEAYRAFSATDILNGRIAPELLENTWVLVGYTAFGLIDIVPTPYDGAAPGVEVQARILGSILDNNVPYTPRAAAVLLILLALCFAAALWMLASARDKLASYGLAASALLLPFAALALHMLTLAQANLWLGWFAPALFGFVAPSLLLLHELARVRLERGRVLGNLSSYLPAEVAEEIAYALPNSSINAHRKNVTLLSADLRNFSAYGESRPPEEAAALLHYFFVRTTEIIEKHHGRVHEFKGDSLLAIWDGSDNAAASAALQAALVMQQTMIEVLPQHPPAGLEPLALGIGIEQGPVLIGSIGPAHRRTHTLLGETVTITLRIQEMTADLAHPVLVGECAARQLAEQGLISQGSYLLNGLRNPHILYAPPLRDPSQLSARNDAPSLRLLRGGRS